MWSLDKEKEKNKELLNQLQKLVGEIAQNALDIQAKLLDEQE